jgi:hypothetical protein
MNKALKESSRGREETCGEDPIILLIKHRGRVPVY